MSKIFLKASTDAARMEKRIGESSHLHGTRSIKSLPLRKGGKNQPTWVIQEAIHMQSSPKHLKYFEIYI